MTIMKNKSATVRRNHGFSMIDVLVAIVVLATGLLALAALQGALTRSSTDSRARAQIAAYADGLVDQLRASGYRNIAAGTISTTSVDRDHGRPLLRQRHDVYHDRAIVSRQHHAGIQAGQHHHILD